MKNILTYKSFLILAISYWLLAISNNTKAQQVNLGDTTIYIALDTLRMVYIHADTGKALNRLDKMGRKQGLWQQKYDNGNIRYKGHFKDDEPYGVFKYYYEDDSLKIIALYSDNGKVARSHEYYESGVMAAMGKYVNQKKDSVWKYFDEVQNLRAKEQYADGKLEGKSVTFYADGNVLESKMWHNNEENGLWQQFYEDGALRMECNYVNGQLNGVENFYDEDGKIIQSGPFLHDKKNGLWTYYYGDGRKDTATFIQDKPINPGRFNLSPSKVDSLKKQDEIKDEELQHHDPGGNDDDYGN